MSIFDEDSYVLILNGSNLVTSDTTNSTYRFNFNGTRLIKDTKIAIANVSLFYSWFNISANFNNNFFQYTFTNGAGTSTFNVNIVDGYYTIAQLNSYLQSVMITNGHYLVNGSGQNVYYLEILENLRMLNMPLLLSLNLLKLSSLHNKSFQKFHDLMFLLLHFQKDNAS